MTKKRCCNCLHIGPMSIRSATAQCRVDPPEQYEIEGAHPPFDKAARYPVIWVGSCCDKWEFMKNPAEGEENGN